MEAARYSETSVSYRKTTRRYIIEDFDLKLHRSENVKFRTKEAVKIATETDCKRLSLSQYIPLVCERVGVCVGGGGEELQNEVCTYN